MSTPENNSANPDIAELEQLSKLVRYFIMLSTTSAGSGHPTSSLSAADLMTVLFFGGFLRTDLENHEFANNDRIIFSKGHASPLFYALYAAANKIPEAELKTLRKFGSRLEGHPTPEFIYTEAATGSLGQGLSIGFGMALNAKYIDKLPYKTFVLLGDSEMLEGSQWEAIQLTEHYKLNNLIGIMDVNRLGQRGATMYGHDMEAYAKRVAAFGWEVISIDGHNLNEIIAAYQKAATIHDKPVMIIAKTFKGAGISFLQDQDNWHGKALSQDDFSKAIEELGEFDQSMRGKVLKPENILPASKPKTPAAPLAYDSTKLVATRRAYGNALARIAYEYPEIISLDAEVSNSTYAEFLKKQFPDRFFEMFIAEQNMIGAALGLSRRGKIPFVSTFAAFLSRGFDQIRMSQYSISNIKFVGSHCGVSIGEDGGSQMGLEDLAMFRTLLNAVVLYPSDAISTEKLMVEAVKHFGNVYLRTTRKDTPILYSPTEEFPIGGSKTLKSSVNDQITVIGGGVTLFEALSAYEQLQKEGINIRVIDLYSVKPVDSKTLHQAAAETKALLVVEDHFIEGGMGDAVRADLADSGKPVYSLAVEKMPRSGKPDELIDYENISARAIVAKVKSLLNPS